MSNLQQATFKNKMAKLVLGTMAINCLLLSSAIISEANAQVRPLPRPERRAPQVPPRPYPPTVGTQSSAVANVHMYMDKRDQLDVIRELKIKRDLSMGKKVVSMSVVASSSEYQAKLVLKLNGQRVDAVKLSPYSATYQMQVPSHLSAHDQLVLSPTGAAYVSTISAKLSQVSRPPRPQPPGQSQVLRAQLNQYVYGQETLPVKKLISESTGARLAGMKVQSVVLKASSTARHRLATAYLMVNNQPVGAPQNLQKGAGSRYVFDLPVYAQNIIGQDIKSLQVVVRGDAHVQMLGLKTGESYGTPSTIPVQAHVNRSFRGSEKVSLEELLYHAPGARTYAPIEAITVVAKGAGNIMLTKRAQVLGSMNFGSFGSKQQAVRLSGNTKISDVELLVSGRITIESIRIKFK